MATTPKNRTNTQGKDQQVIQGIQKDLQTMSSLFLGGETFTPASLVTFIQSRIDAGNQVVIAKAAWQSAVKSYAAINAKATVVEHDLKQLVIGAFGATSSKLADFGFTPKKVTVLTPDQKAAAAQKRAATRKARNTMGPKAKLAVKGTVTTTEPAKTTTPAAPAAPATPPPVTAGTAAPPAAPSATPPVASATAPAQAPTVTVNVTTAPGTQPAATPATATDTTPAQAPAPAAAPATAPTAAGAPAPAKS